MDLRFLEVSIGISNSTDHFNSPLVLPCFYFRS